jgi:type IV pilus assembly protein PilY1
MMTFNDLFKVVCQGVIITWSASSMATVTSADFSATPPSLTDAADPFVMINLSVELTQQAEAYTDGAQVLVGGSVCPGRLNGYGICYTSSEEYLGYFDSSKCYVYDTSGANTNTEQVATGPQDNADPHYFRPVGYAVNRECSGAQFSGNFMNWASMTALDEFRYAMTGGARLLDTAGSNAKTYLTRTHRYGDWSFVPKRIHSSGLTNSGITFTTNPSNVTPFSVNDLYITSHSASNSSGGGGTEFGNRIRFYDASNALLGEYNVVVQVCNASVGLEANCVEYSDGVDTWYKPEGVMQEHALEMRYALTSYTGHDSNNRNGGVLRANAKYVGIMRPLISGGLEANPAAEINERGQYVYNPDNVAIADGVNNSGILNYINSFGLGPERYKSFDPVAELYYESLRYIKNLGRTPEYADAVGSLSAITNDQKDNFPIVTSWNDPVLHACQANYVVAVGDQFAWGDNSLPGATVTGSGEPSLPSNPDSDIDVDTLTDFVGTLEGFYPGTLGAQTRGRDNNGWYFAGLTYYASTRDIRTDIAGDQTVKTFVVDTQEYNGNPPIGVNNPLWLAAKYGGFEDSNSDGDPNNGSPGTSTDEWDADGDGQPDTYTLASQPANLIKGINAAFSDISDRVSSGSAASVVTNSSAGDGAVFQGLYKPAEIDGNDRVEWGGILHALFIDEYGNFREDTNGDDALTNADTVITFAFDQIQERTFVTRHTTSNGGETFSDAGLAPVEVDDLDTIWNARDELAALTNVITQRDYETVADSGRYVFSAIDSDNDGVVVESDVVPFDASTFAAAGGDNFRYLGLDSATSAEAENIVNFVRGQDGLVGYRSRTIDYDGDGNDEVWRLGDIIHSSPVAVSRPSDRYDLLYDDDTYRAFRAQYLDRRTVVYTGANDGLLHAFNGGFYSSSDDRFLTSPAGSIGITAHPLGSELWSYAPYNLLPHLRWLTEVGYPHAYYVDGIPQVFDVNIFPDDATHPNGWGTILVVGLRFGGGDITFDPDSDTDADTSDDVTTRSSYIVLDITDPEQEPQLVAEFSHPDMGYATTRAALIKNRKPDPGNGSFENPSENEWSLVVGSGPFGDTDTARRQALTDGVSNQNAKLFVFDLISKTFVNQGGGDASFEVIDGTDGFVGDLTSADWDRDFQDDVVYFGTVQGSVAVPDGELMRFVIGSDFTLASSTFSKVINKSGGVGQPFSGKPYATRSSNGDFWVYAGTGRFYVADDGLSSAQQSFYGLKEPVDANGDPTYAALSYSSDLIDTTDIDVFSDRTVERGGATLY